MPFSHNWSWALEGVGNMNRDLSEGDKQANISKELAESRNKK